MKLDEINKPKTDETGSYAGVRFSTTTTKALEQYIEDNKIPNPLDAEHFHTTLLYSRKFLPDYEPAGKYKVPFVGTPKILEVWPSQPDENGKVKNCLVLTYDCPKLYQRHHKLMNQHGATYDFDEYKPHVTLSYDIGDFKIDKLSEFEEDLEIVEEYGEDLKTTGWADDKAKKEK